MNDKRINEGWSDFFKEAVDSAEYKEVKEDCKGSLLSIEELMLQAFLAGMFHK